MKKTVRPATVAEMLDEVAVFLDLLDRATVLLYKVWRKPTDPPEWRVVTEVQDDMRSLATVLRANPRLDRELQILLKQEQETQKD
jgi:hypothetical protein